VADPARAPVTTLRNRARSAGILLICGAQLPRGGRLSSYQISWHRCRPVMRAMVSMAVDMPGLRRCGTSHTKAQGSSGGHAGPAFI
jgi:hypothetical protein